MGARFSRSKSNAAAKPDVALVEKDVVKSDDIESGAKLMSDKASMLAMLAIPALLALYAATAIFKTIFTKAIFQNIGFPYPMTISALSCVFTALACVPLAAFIPGVLSFPPKNAAKGILWVSLLTGVDMVFSNVALNRISASLQQVIKATQVIWVLIFELVMQNKRPKPDIWIYVVLMVIGAPAAAIGSAAEDFDLFGCILMVIATGVGALKYVSAHDVIRAHRKELGSVGFIYWLELSMLVYMVPWACLSNEITRTDPTNPGVIMWMRDTANPIDYFYIVTNCLMGGFRAYISFVVLRFCSALQLVFTNIAVQSLVVITSIAIFNTAESTMGWVGIALTLVGYTAYSIRIALMPKDTKH